MRVGVVYGGRSGEHEVSLRSAASIIAALDRTRYEVVPIAIGKDGRWLSGPESLQVLEDAQRDLAPIPEHGAEVTIPPEPTRHAMIPINGGVGTPLDVVFPVLHGTYGEDGTVQGLLELAGIPYVGAGVLASAVGMDKALMKSVFRDAGIPSARWIVIETAEPAGSQAVADQIAAAFGFPCFVKPANMGSSVGISKVKAPEDLAAAVSEAATYDSKVVIEEAIEGRELECAVLGNHAPEASVIGELVPSREFYDYADKYVEEGARIIIPAQLPPETAAAMRELAMRAYRAIDCTGLARVDFFLARGNRILVNEINTMPGFTTISMYPKLWEASGLPFPALLDRLIALALERHAERARRRLSFTPPEATPVVAPRRARR
jgi:D-alanine-D-alanine ligase